MGSHPLCLVAADRHVYPSKPMINHVLLYGEIQTTGNKCPRAVPVQKPGRKPMTGRKALGCGATADRVTFHALRRSLEPGPPAQLLLPASVLPAGPTLAASSIRLATAAARCKSNGSVMGNILVKG